MFYWFDMILIEFSYCRCYDEFKSTKSLLGDPAALKSKETVERIKSTALLFGELLCNMKVCFFYAVSAS